MFYTARHQGLLEEIEDQNKYNEVLKNSANVLKLNTPKITH